MVDESLHEIQLNGKQLVFLFMAVTVVAVVIFLCGVMVGRGVRTQRAAVETAESVVPTDPTALQAAATDPGATSSLGSADKAVPFNEDITYPSRLDGDRSVDDDLKPSRPPAAAAALPSARVAPPVKAAVVDAVPASAAEPSGQGFVVQVAATRERREADTIATGLSRKGYPAFVTPTANGPRMFRVRVGKYKSRQEAQSVAGRLQKEEQFKTWITR